MANSIEYAQKFVPIIDAIYKQASVTQNMDAATRPDFSGTNEVKVLKVSTTGLGKGRRYSRLGNDEINGRARQGNFH